MRKILQFTIILSTLCALQAKAQIATGYEVGTWYGFKTAALTYSFDDNTSNQTSVAMPMFDKYGYKMSFNVISGSVSDWSVFISASNNGHEIASHTVTHKDLKGVDVNTQDQELKNSQTTINSKITNAKCLTFIYPYCNIGDVTTMSKYYISGRDCSGQINGNSITNFWTISSIICGSSGLNTPQAFNDKAVAAKNSKGWCVFLIHGINGQGGYSPLESSVLSSHLQYINTNDADYWVATQLNVVKYIKERMAASLTETTITSDSLKAVLTDGLDNSIYDAAISIRRKMPTGWAGAKVYLGTSKIASTTTTINGTTYIVFNVAPDKGNIFLANTAAAPSTATPTVVSPVNYCQGTTATALSATGTSLKWYTAATGGTAATTAPTPSTTTVGTTSYYVSQTLNNIESSRAKIDVVVSATPAAPSVTPTVSYAKNATATALTATGTNLQWYAALSGGTGSSLAPTPSTGFAGTTKYYVSQSSNGCESARSEIAVTVTAPVVKIPLTTGWNWIGCPLDGSTPVETAMANIWSSVLSVKDLQSFYLSTNPAELNLLKSVIWGEGYMIKVSKNCELIWTK